MVPVIPSTSSAPVNGARTTAVKNAAIPTIASNAGDSAVVAQSTFVASAKSAPTRAPTTRSGAKIPPGVPADRKSVV